MTNNHNGHLADWSLVLFIGVFIGCTALLIADESSVLLACIQAVSAAAIIGGVADWYGVASIYGKPFGFSYKTEIVISKRKELFESLRLFVCDDVLSKENIQNKLENYQFCDKLLKLVENEGDEVKPFSLVRDFISEILKETLKNINTEDAVNYFTELMITIVSCVKPSDDLLRIGRKSLESGYVDDFIDALAPELMKISGNEGLREVVEAFSARAIDQYSDSSKRELFKNLLKSRIVSGVFEVLSGGLKEIKEDRFHPSRFEIKSWIDKELKSIEDNPEQRAVLDKQITEWVQSGKLKDFLDGEIHRVGGQEFLDSLKPEEQVGNGLQYFIDKVKQNEPLRKKIDVWIINQAITLIEKNHSRIGDLVRSNLDGMSDYELVGFIKDNTESDLQMIRLNGMGFGILIGLIVFGVRQYFGI